MFVAVGCGGDAGDGEPNDHQSGDVNAPNDGNNSDSGDNTPDDGNNQDSGNPPDDGNDGNDGNGEDEGDKPIALDCGEQFISFPAGTYTSVATASTVNMAAFCLARTETTVAQFKACVEAGACSTDNFKIYNVETYDTQLNYGSPEDDDRSDHPMNGVNWYGADEYCKWIGGRLPTAFEWEYAATHNGTQALMTLYPWGNDAPTENHMNYYANVLMTTPVGTYSPLGDSPLGLQDMGGNVAEWTADVSSEGNGTEPRYVLKGGHWNDFARTVTESDPSLATQMHMVIGFRCAK